MSGSRIWQAIPSADMSIAMRIAWSHFHPMHGCSLGFRVYGVAAMLLGIVGLVWDDFALVWQPVPHGLPGRPELAFVAAALLFLGGALLNWRTSAYRGACLLLILYAIDVLVLHVPRLVEHPLTLTSWSGVAEQLALVVGGMICVMATRPWTGPGAARWLRVARMLFGGCLLVFGAVHFKYAEATAAMVPAWLPPGPFFWAYATGIAHVTAGICILANRKARLAAIWLTVMFAGFGILVHLPLLWSDPSSHLNWVMNAMNLALTGSAWVVADSYLLPGRSFT